MTRDVDAVRMPPTPAAGQAADLECVRRIGEGHAQSLVDLYDRHGATMYSLALHILKREADAQDVVGEVFTHLWRERAPDDARGEVVAVWLLILTRNRAIDRLRTFRSRAEKPQPGECVMRGHTASTIDDPNAMTGWAVCEQVRQRLNSLPVVQRRAIEMIYFEGFGVQEIATALERSSGTVKRDICLALLELRTALTPDRS